MLAATGVADGGTGRAGTWLTGAETTGDGELDAGEAGTDEAGTDEAAPVAEDPAACPEPGDAGAHPVSRAKAATASGKVNLIVRDGKNIMITNLDKS